MAGSALRHAAATLLTLPLAVAGLSCSAADAGQPPRPIERTRAAATSPDDAVNMVLAISVDGLNSKTIRALRPKRTPVLHRMMRQSSGTLNARTAREQTRTLPNHIGMLTGCRIDDDHGGHGVTYNADHGSTATKAAGDYAPSVFDVVHDHGGRTALYAAKFRMFARTWNAHGAPDRVGRNHGMARIDQVRIDSNNSRLVNTVVTELKGKPRPGSARTTYSGRQPSATATWPTSSPTSWTDPPCANRNSTGREKLNVFPS
jgi:hypothetical protein